MLKASKLVIFIFTMACVSDVHAQVPPEIVSLFVQDSEGGAPIAEGVAQSDDEVFAIWSFASTNDIYGFSYAINEEPDKIIELPISQPYVALGPLDNGVSTFSVLAIDKADNVGPSSSFDIVVLSADADADGVLDGDDNCPGTIIPESMPTRSLGVNRFSLVGGDNVFDTTAPNGKGPRLSYTTADTAGCSCTQIIEVQGLDNGHTKFGCSISAMDDWVLLVNPQEGDSIRLAVDIER